MRPQAGAAPVNPTDPVLFGTSPRTLLQSGISFVLGPSSYTQNNGVVVIGQRPASSATVTFSATSGTGVTCTFSAATLGGTSALDTGRVLTILDTTYKFFTVTGNSGSSTTVCQGTLSGGTLSTVGAFANTALWLSNNAAGSNAGYGMPLPRVVGNSYSYFPAGAIQTGSAAGWYWTNWSSTTVGQVYNNAYGSGAPVIASPTAFSTTGPGAFTQTSGVPINGPLLSLPGNSMGINGALELSLWGTFAANTNTKSLNMYAAGLTVGRLLGAGNIAIGGMISLQNQGVANSQVSVQGAGAGNDYAGASANAANFTAIDTTVSQNVGARMQINVNTDYLFLERYSLKLHPTSP